MIVTELNLPAMPAWRLAQWLSQSWRTRHIPIIVLDGDIDPALPQDLGGHVASVLTKPFPLVQMLEEIRRTLRAGDPGRG